MGFNRGNIAKKNTEKSLPLGIVKQLGFDGVDDGVIINNSSSGDGLRFEYTNPFTITARFNLLGEATGSYVLYGNYQSSSAQGLILQCNVTSPTSIVLAFGFYSSATNRRTTFLNINRSTEYIIVAQNNGLNQSTSLTLSLYTGNGTFITSTSTQNVNNVMNSTIKTGMPMCIGSINSTNYFKGYIKDVSVWNYNFNSTDRTEFIETLLKNQLNTHSLYSTNCISYWNKYIGSVAINDINPDYNGTINIKYQ